MRLLFYSNALTTTPTGHHSKSHSAGLTVLLLHDRPCGGDVELVRERAFTVSRWYPPQEREPRLRLQYLLWTRREALYKLLCSEGTPLHFRQLLGRPVYEGGLVETVGGVRYCTRWLRCKRQSYVVSTAVRPQAAGDARA